MFLHLFTVTARIVELRANSQVSLDSVAELTKEFSDMTTKIDTQVPESEYIVQAEDISLNVPTQEGLKEILSITSSLKEVPVEMPEIIDALSGLKEDPIADLKSGAYSFAVLFTDNPENIKNLKGIEEVSHIKFFLCTQKAVSDALKCPFPGILAFNSADKNIFKMPFHSNFQGLVSAITVPAFTRINQENFKYLQTLDQRIFYIIDEAHKFEANKAAFEEQAKISTGFAKFVYFTPEDVPSLIELLRCNTSEYPLMVSLAKEGKGIVRSITSDGFSAAVQSLLNQQAEKLVFSSTLPEDNESRPVKVVNTETLTKTFETEDRDVLVAFTSPRCGYCKALEPVLKKLVTLLEEKGIQILVGDYNIMENEENPDFQVSGVPTLFFKKKGTDSPIQVPSDVRSLKEFLTYLSKEGVSSMINLSDFSEHMKDENQHASISEEREEEPSSPEELKEEEGKGRDVL